MRTNIDGAGAGMARRRLLAALGFSLFAHLLLLAGPFVAGARPPAGADPLRLTLRQPASRLLPEAALAPPARTGERATRPSPVTPPAIPARPSASSPSSASPLAASPPSDAEASPSPAAPQRLDREALRAQARALPGGTPRTGEGPFAGRAAAPAGEPPPLVDRPVVEALARRLGVSPAGASERTLADGSRVIRYAGNRCVHLPLQLPAWRESRVVPTEFVPVNCPE